MSEGSIVALVCAALSAFGPVVAVIIQWQIGSNRGKGDDEIPWVDKRAEKTTLPLTGRGQGWGEEAGAMANQFARELRKNMTDAERKLWLVLRDLRTEGFHFRRQAPIDQFIVDFVCLSQRLVVEVDGGQHYESAGLRADAAREAHLRWQGFSILRFTNRDVLTNIDSVMIVISDALGLIREPSSPLLNLPPTPTPPC